MYIPYKTWQKGEKNVTAETGCCRGDQGEEASDINCVFRRFLSLPPNNTRRAECDLSVAGAKCFGFVVRHVVTQQSEHMSFKPACHLAVFPV